MQAYTYDANGNRLTKAQSGVTTTYTYNNGGRLVSDGTSTYTYDAARNLTARGSDTFSYDYASRMTAATVGGVTSTYAYDGDDVRTSVTAGGTTSPQVWDRVCSHGTCGPSCGGQSRRQVPLLVDDSANDYLWAEGLVAEVSTSGARLDDLGDGLGSTRGWTNSSGAMTSTADYDVFGAVRTSTGSPGAFRYTGEQWDASTGLEYLRARYYNPTLGRFTSADTMQPNAPGTQGWNLYAYVANNPTTWTDPTGHSAAAGAMPRQPVAGGAVSESIAPYQVAAGVIMGGALAGLGLTLAGGFQLLADIFWLLAHGRVLFDVLDDYFEHRSKECSDRYGRCMEEFCDPLEGTPEWLPCQQSCNAEFVDCMWAFNP